MFLYFDKFLIKSIFIKNNIVLVKSHKEKVEVKIIYS